MLLLTLSNSFFCVYIICKSSDFSSCNCLANFLSLSSLLNRRVSRPNFSILNELDELEPSDSLFITVSVVTILSLPWLDTTSTGGVGKSLKDIFFEISFLKVCAKVATSSELTIFVTSFFLGFNSSSVNQT